MSKRKRSSDAKEELRVPSERTLRDVRSLHVLSLLSDCLSTNVMSQSSLSTCREDIQLSRSIGCRCSIGGIRIAITIPSENRRNVRTCHSGDSSRDDLHLDRIDFDLVKAIRQLSKHGRVSKNEERVVRIKNLLRTDGVQLKVPGNHSFDQEASCITLLHRARVLTPETPFSSVEPKGDGVRAGVSAAAGVVTCHLAWKR